MLVNEYACNRCGLTLAEELAQDAPDKDCPNCGERDWKIAKQLNTDDLQDG